MPELAKDTVALLTFLLPGFLVAWVLYALTSLQKPVQSERVIQALIFTLFVKIFVIIEQWILECVGRIYFVGVWSPSVELGASLATAIGIGFLATWIVNGGRLHDLLRVKGISNRSSQPSEWCDVFSKYPMYVTLHLKDDRRLFGWPEEWPSDPEKGHFFIFEPEWVHVIPSVPVSGVEGMLVNVTEIKFVEFVRNQKE